MKFVFQGKNINNEIDYFNTYSSFSNDFWF